MGDRTEQSIVIDAKPEDVMSVIADFDRYPDWVSAAKEVTVLGRDDAGAVTEVRFTLDAGFLKDTYVLAYTWAADGLQVSWSLVSSSIMKAQEGHYVLTPVEDAKTSVTYGLEVSLTIPMIGMLRRKAEKTITDAALKELKKRVEQGR